MEDVDEEEAVLLSSASDSSDPSVEFVDDDDDDPDFSIVEVDKCDDHAPITAQDVPSREDSKSQNVAALVRGNTVANPQPLVRRVISASDGVSVVRKPFKPPFLKGTNDYRDQLHQRLSLRKRFVPWGFTTPFKISLNSLDPTTDKKAEKEDVAFPQGLEPLVLWQRGCKDGSAELTPIIMVDPLLVRFLRPHQREGVRFMFECVSGLHTAGNIFGCILADDMGLGKTLQSITLLYTLLRQGFDGKPMVKKAIIVTPTSLVRNWEAEIKKWIGDRVQLSALCESSREDVISAIDSFMNPWSKIQVLIISYETFRMHSSKFSQKESCDLLICDEAHRLKNDRTRTNRALASLLCKRRILLSGTPMQNDLEEFYAMVNFTNPGILGDASHFRRYYEMPIVCGREPTATEDEKRLGLERSEELSSKVNPFILRRTNALLSNHLPPKMVEVVCCKLTPVQSDLYDHFIQSKNVKRVITEDGKQSKILAYITALKKLCNHPKLIYDTIKDGNSGISGFEDCMRFFPSKFFSPRSGAWTGADGLWVELSGKMNVLARLLSELRQKTDDRIVLVSNYTQTLDLFAQLCCQRRYPYLKLDGTTSISKRQELVNRFNDPSKDEFVFLLSSKAGGCGLNLIGGNRLVLFDPDWNPANDKQAAARVWRDGQKKRVYVYRFLSTGTIEEKMYQRQMSKEGLQKVIQQEQTVCDKGNFFSVEDLRDLFTYRVDVRSEIHDKMNCIRCIKNYSTKGNRCESTIEFNRVESVSETCQTSEHVDIGGFAEISGCLHKLQGSERQVGTPLEEDLLNWAHHSSPTSVPDVVFQASAGNEVTFVFTNQIEGKLIPIESMSPKIQDVQATSTFSGLSRPNSRENQNSKSVMASVASSNAVRVKPISSLRDMTNLSWKPMQSVKRQPPLKRSFHCIEGDDAVG